MEKHFIKNTDKNIYLEEMDFQFVEPQLIENSSVFSQIEFYLLFIFITLGMGVSYLSTSIKFESR